MARAKAPLLNPPLPLRGKGGGGLKRPRRRAEDAFLPDSFAPPDNPLQSHHRNPAMRVALLIAVLLLLPACTWVRLNPAARPVKVIAAGAAPPGCEQRGEVAVSVKDKVAFYERNNLRVRDELETLARNEAPGIQADTIQPLGEPADGAQRFAAYRCGR